MQDIPSLSDASNLLFVDGSAPHLDPSSQIWRSDHMLNEAEATFTRYAEDLIQSKMFEQLKQFRDRGKLEIKLEVTPYDKEKNEASNRKAEAAAEAKDDGKNENEAKDKNDSVGGSSVASPKAGEIYMLCMSRLIDLIGGCVTQRHQRGDA